MEHFFKRAVRRGKAKAFAAEAPVEPRAADGAPRPARLAIMLALAHKIQEAIDRGRIKNRAEASRRLGVTRVRVTQILNLTLLAPAIQEELLLGQGVIIRRRR
jgi:hypothetical protein